MTVILQVVDLTWLRPELGTEPNAGQYLRWFDVARHDGLAPFPLTDRPDEAAQFDDEVAALAFWKTQSVVCPLRDDGLPNRPLTALSVEVVRLPETRDLGEK